MRSVFIGTILTIFLAHAGTVQAANGLDGKAVFCISGSEPRFYYGLEFDQGKVTKHDVKGYSKVIAYRVSYRLEGTYQVWVATAPVAVWVLNRETLKVGSHHIHPQGNQCSLFSRNEIFQKLDEIIAAAKMTNKI
jgi:hypothetical protein